MGFFVYGFGVDWAWVILLGITKNYGPIVPKLLIQLHIDPMSFLQLTALINELIYNLQDLIAIRYTDFRPLNENYRRPDLLQRFWFAWRILIGFNTAHNLG